jgi:dGTPase
MLPDDWQHWASKGGDSQKAWVIADYIAGMTDRYALQEYGKLTNPMEKA